MLHSIPLLLVSLAAGYAVLVLSNKQDRPLDVLGRILGGLILLVSIVGLICVTVCSMKCRRNQSCDKPRMSAECPYMSKSCPTEHNPGAPVEAMPEQK